MTVSRDNHGSYLVEFIKREVSYGYAVFLMALFPLGIIISSVYGANILYAMMSSAAASLSFDIYYFITLLVAEEVGKKDKLEGILWVSVSISIKSALCTAAVILSG